VVSLQFGRSLAGLTLMFPSMFNQQELQILLGGVDSPVDLEDLQHNTSYGGLYDIENDTIQAFWKVSRSLSHINRSFCTYC
jgi:hypothetical protein